MNSHSDRLEKYIIKVQRSPGIHCMKCSFLPQTFSHSLKKSFSRDKSSPYSVIFKARDYTYINNVNMLNTLQYITNGSELKKKYNKDLIFT